jgi:hypothetical protein
LDGSIPTTIHRRSTGVSTRFPAGRNRSNMRRRPMALAIQRRASAIHWGHGLCASMQRSCGDAPPA